jgi:small conductance mechanosensitive channel
MMQRLGCALFAVDLPLSLEPVSTAWTRAVDAMPNLGAGVAIVGLFWGAGVLARQAIVRLGRTRRVDPDVTAFVGQSAKIGLVLVGVVTGLSKIGIDISAMVAGLGLTGLVIGLAMKEIVSNALAGMQILAYKPFKRNDEISVQTFQGRVIEVNLRYTALETAAGRACVPNTILTTSTVVVVAKPQANGTVEPAGDDRRLT